MLQRVLQSTKSKRINDNCLILFELILKKMQKKTACLGGRACFFCYTMRVTALPVVSGKRYECL